MVRQSRMHIPDTFKVDPPLSPPFDGEGDDAPSHRMPVIFMCYRQHNDNREDDLTDGPCVDFAEHHRAYSPAAHSLVEEAYSLEHPAAHYL